MTDVVSTSRQWKTRLALPRDYEFHNDMAVEAVFGEFVDYYSPQSMEVAKRLWTGHWGKPGDLGRVVMDVQSSSFQSVGMAWGRSMRTLGIERMRKFSLKPDDIEVAVALTKDVRGQGIGSLVLGSLMSNYHEAGVSNLYLHVLDSNEAAKRLYASKGFEPVMDTHNPVIHQTGKLMVADLTSLPIE